MDGSRSKPLNFPKVFGEEFLQVKFGVKAAGHVTSF